MKYFTVSILQLLLVFPILSLASAEPFALPLALAKAQSSGEDCNKYCNPMSDTISKCAKAHGLLNEDGSPGPKDGTFPQEYKSCLCDADSGFSENYNKCNECHGNSIDLNPCKDTEDKEESDPKDEKEESDSKDEKEDSNSAGAKIMTSSSLMSWKIVGAMGLAGGVIGMI